MTAIADPFTASTVAFYSVGYDPEELTDTTPEEAVASYIDAMESVSDGDPERDPAALRQIVDYVAPLAVQAWTRQIVPPDWIKSMAGDLADKLSEAFDGDFGPPTDHVDEWSRQIAAETLNAKQCAETLVDAFVQRVGVWRCNVVAERVYSADELWALLCPYYGHGRAES